MLTRVITWTDGTIEELPLEITKDWLSSDKVILAEFVNLDDKEIELLQSELGVHELAIHDVQDVLGRTKFEDHEDCLYFGLKDLERIEGEISRLQLSLFYFPNLIVCIREPEIDIRPVYDALERKVIDSNQPEKLVHFIVDLLTENHFMTFAAVQEELDDLEERTYREISKKLQADLIDFREMLLMLRKVARGTREVMFGVLRSDSALLDETNTAYWTDAMEETAQLLDLVEIERDLINGLHQNVINALSTQVNEVMQTLTILTALIMIPTFLASIGGMNTEPLPIGTNWWAWMALMLASMMLTGLYFRRKGWF